MAHARRTDSETSHLAAHQIEASGKAAAQRELCLDCVKKNPGRTTAEIASILGIDRHIPGRRMKELEDADLVRRGTKRRCEVNHTMAHVYYAIQKPGVQKELFE